MPGTVTSVRWLPTAAMMRVLPGAESAEEALIRVQKLADEVPAESDPIMTCEQTVTPSPVVDEFNLAGYDEEPVINSASYFSHLDADLRLNAQRDPQQNYEVASDSEDEEFYEVKASDVVFACSTAEEEQCYVEVFVHDTETGALFVRQTFDLNAFPLCTEFLQGTGLLAVGTFDSAVEFWDLADLSPDEPVSLLGVRKTGSSKQKKNKHKSPASHSDAVLSLSSGPGGVLVSGSADKTVRLWDVNEKRHVAVFTHHSDKVQSVVIHGKESNVVATAAYDGILGVLDMRSGGVRKGGIGAGADPEALMWIGDYELLVSSENGQVKMFDVRSMAKALWTVKAHDGACTSLAKLKEREFVSVGADGFAKVWSIEKGVPEVLKTKDMKTGPLFTVAAIDDHPDFVAFGGAEAGIWAV